MAELSGLFQNLGPTTASLMSGIQAGQQYNENEAAQQLRAAQLEKTIQDTRQAELMNPMLIQAKQQEIASANLRAQQEKEAYRDEVMGKAIPILAQTPALQRHARMEEMFTQAGLPLDQADKQHLYSLNPDQLVKEMKDKYEWSITQNPQYRREMDKQRLHNQGQLDVENARQTAKEKAAKEKASAETSLQQDLSKAKTYQTQAVVYSSHAAKARLKGDTEEATRLEGLAKQATAQDLSARAAAGDAQAQNQLRLLQGFGVQMQNTPPASPATPAAPALPTGWSLKQ